MSSHLFYKGLEFCACGIVGDSVTVWGEIWGYYPMQTAKDGCGGKVIKVLATREAFQLNSVLFSLFTSFDVFCMITFINAPNFC